VLEREGEGERERERARRESACAQAREGIETCFGVKRDLLQRKKRPITVSKETYYRGDRDLTPDVMCVREKGRVQEREGGREREREGGRERDDVVCVREKERARAGGRGRGREEGRKGGRPRDRDLSPDVASKRPITMSKETY